MAGRGWGKTRTGAEAVRYAIEELGYKRIGLVGATAADTRDVMVEGESGLLSVCPLWFEPKYEPSKRRITWPNGAIATLFSADKPDRLRGPQFDLVWCDELAAWRYLSAWDMIMFCLRLGNDPKAIITTTPRPIKIVKDLLNSEHTFTVSGSTYENRTNLAQAFYDEVISRYEGTRLGRQELYAEVIEDDPDALWNREIIDANRVEKPGTFYRIVVAIDPAGSSKDTANETGIVVVGLGEDNHGYVIEDLSLRASPHGWAERAINAYYEFGADRIIGEANNGGEMIESTIRSLDPNVSYKNVYASRGKQTRAEPVAALYEQGKVHHVGNLPQLEDQLCTWVPNSGMVSPDRLDALVWGMTELMLQGREKVRVKAKSVGSR